MSTHQNRARVGVLIYCLLQTVLQVLLMRRILNDRNRERIEISHVTPGRRPRDRLDLLDIRNRPGRPPSQQRAQHGRLRVRVYARASTALRERCHEQRRASARLQVQRLAEVGLRGVVEDEHVLWGEALLLHARGRDEDVVVLLGARTDRDAAASARDPAQLVEVAAETAYLRAPV